MGLWKEEVKESMQMAELRQSPSSITNLNNAANSSSCSIPKAPSEICVRWREKIVEWKYQVVDRFGESHFSRLASVSRS